MSLFKKKKEEKNMRSDVYSCGCAPASSESSCCSNANGSRIKVLGMGCASCHEQYTYVKEAVQALGLSETVDYITDLQQVMSYGVMTVPAIVVDETVVSAGKVLKPGDVVTLLKKYGF